MQLLCLTLQLMPGLKSRCENNELLPFCHSRFDLFGDPIVRGWRMLPYSAANHSLNE